MLSLLGAPFIPLEKSGMRRLRPAAASCLNKCPASHKLHIFIQLSRQSGLRRSPTPLRAATMVYWRGASTYLNRMAVDEFRRCVQRHGRRQQAAALSPPLAAALPPAARRTVLAHRALHRLSESTTLLYRMPGR